MNVKQQVYEAKRNREALEGEFDELIEALQVADTEARLRESVLD